MNWYSIAYGVGTAIIVFLTYRFYVNTPDTESKLYFSLMGTVASIWVGSEFFYYTFWGELSLVFYYIKYIGITLTPYAVLMSTLTTPIRSRVMKFKYTPYILVIPPLISLIFVFTNPLTHLFFSSFTEIHIGDGYVRYTGSWGPVAKYWHLPYSYLCLLGAFTVLILNIRKSKTKIDYYLLTTLFIAVLVPVIMNVILLYFWNIYPDPTSLTIIFSAGFMTYMLSRYKLFRLPKEIYTELPEREVPNVEFGKNYLIYGGGYSLIKEIARSRPTLIIGTRSPRWMHEFIGKEDVPVIWLSEVDSENSILPERLEFEIEYTAIEFWRENPRGTVVFEGIGYIRAFNSIERMQLFMKDIIDVSSQYDGSLIILADDLYLLEDAERESFENMFDEVRNMSDFVSYGLFLIDDDVPNSGEMLCVSSENPEKYCPDFEKSIWVRRGGKYPPESMRMEVLYEIERYLSSNKEVAIYKLDELFIGWKNLKIYSYLKLLADLTEKYGSKIHIVGKVSRDEIKRIVLMFS